METEELHEASGPSMETEETEEMGEIEEVSHSGVNEEGLPVAKSEVVDFQQITATSVSEGEGVIQIIQLSTEEMSAASPATSAPARPKQKQYVQRYRREWEQLAFCKGWLRPHRINRTLAYCMACDRSLHARKNDLRKHSKCSKHKMNVGYMEQGISVQHVEGKGKRVHPGMLRDPELADWCVELPGKSHRVWCRQCHCSLVAQLKALKTHGKSRKHLANADQEPQSPPQHVEDSYASHDSTGGLDEESAMYAPGRAASPLLESDFSGRVTYSIGLGGRKVGFLGAGQIAQAIAQGMLEQGLLLPQDVMVSAPSQKNMMQWRRWKCRTTNNNNEVVRDADIVFLAVKASVLVRLIGRLTPVSDGRTRLFISLVPGVTRERMTALLSCRILPMDPISADGGRAAEVEVTGPPLHVIRCAPNKMMAISAGFCAYCMGEDVPHSLYLVLETMFSALGSCVQVEESLMDAYGTMIASGAAFTCAFIEAMVQGGVSLDMGWDESLKVASAVVSGTSKLLMRTGVDPSSLRKTISTPGGSTIAGLAALQRGGLDDAVGKALQLACEKTREAGDAVCGGSGSTGGGDATSASL